MKEEELRQYCKDASLEISNMQHTIDNLQSRLKAKEDLLKEAREYVNHSKKNIDESGMYVETYTKWKLVSDVLDDLLEILSKGENK